MSGAAAREYEAAFDLLPHPALLLASDGSLRAVSAAACALAPVDEGGGSLDRWGVGLEALVADFRAAPAAELRALLPQPDPVRPALEVCLRRLPAGGVLATLDPAGTRRAAEALRRTEERSRHLLAGLPHRIFFKDPNGVFVTVNELFARDFGLTPEQMVGKRDSDFFAPTLAEKYRLDDRRILAEGGSETLVESNVIGTVRRVVEVTKKAVIADDGEPLGILGVFTDITERRRVEEELAHERHLLQTLMENMPDLIYFKDRASRFTRMNRAHAETVALSDPEDAVGKSDFDFFPEDQAREFFADEQEIFRTGQPVVNKIEILDTPQGGRRWNLTTKVPVRDAAGEVVGLVGVSRDVTERVQAEADLQRAAEELARSNEDLQQFAYVASHDLQEPLRMVASYTQLLARRYGDRLDDDAREFIGYAVDGATRMQQLINDLLQYSRVGTRGETLQPCSLGDAVERARRNLAPLLEESGAEVRVDPLPILAVDAGQMTQLFQNLLQNAVRFRSEAAPRIHISAERSGGEWIVAVRDNGIGIDPQYAERIFVIFQRLHTAAEFPGSGIGLAICKKIVARHGGRIWVEPHPEGGSVFRVGLPAARAAGAAERTAA